MSRVTSRHTRPKKLTPKHNVPIFREEQVDSINDIDAIRDKVETGVEKAEESVSTYRQNFPLLILTYFFIGISPATDFESSLRVEKR